MLKQYRKPTTIILLIMTTLVFLGADTIRWRPLQFQNPGSRRLLKTSAGNFFYFRTLPEKSMFVDVKDLSTIEIRAFSKAKVNKPRFSLKYKDKKLDFDLTFLAAQPRKDGQYTIYEPIRLTLAPDVAKIELICYNENIYFRVFRPSKTRIKQAKIPSLKILSNSGQYELAKAAEPKTYYGFNREESFSFQVNKGRAFSLFVRAQLTNRQAPVFALYENGNFVKEIALSTKRTRTYTAPGLSNLTVGRKVEFEAKDEIKKYELRAVTEHQFIAKPVIKRKK